MRATRLFFSILFLTCGLLAAGESKKPDAKKAEDADPLAKYTDEQLADIKFCFEAFGKAVAAKDTRTASAFINELPRGLAQLDLKKDADKAAFLKALARFDGASVDSSQRMAGGIGQVTYSAKGGGGKTQRMRNVGGRWKLADLD